MFVNIYRSLKLIIENNQIDPHVGVFQGSVFALICFCIYIDDEVSDQDGTMKQAFVDDMSVQATTMEKLQTTFDELKRKFLRNGLYFNFNKCVLVTDDLNDYIIDSDTGEIIQAI